MPTPAALAAIIVFSLIGMGVFMYAKKMLQIRLMMLGIALMVFPYFIDQTWLLWVIGGTLSTAVYIFRE